MLKKMPCVAGLVLAAAVPCLAADDVSIAGAPLAPETTGVRVPDLPALPSEFSLQTGDGRRTMGRFGANLGRNLVGVFAGDTLKPLALGAAMAGAGSFLDTRTERYFEARPRAPRLGSFGQTLGGASVMLPATGMLFLAGRGSRDARFRAATYDLMQATLVTHTYATALKLSVGRTRPDGSDHLSFPSGHTANAFAWATVARHHYGSRAGVLAYGAAGLIGISRLEKNVHHVSDVLAGAALGYVIGRTVVRGNGEPWRGKKSFTLVPLADPAGRGLGLGLSVTY